MGARLGQLPGGCWVSPGSEGRGADIPGEMREGLSQVTEHLSRCLEADMNRECSGNPD